MAISEKLQISDFDYFGVTSYESHNNIAPMELMLMMGIRCYHNFASNGAKIIENATLSINI